MELVSDDRRVQRAVSQLYDTFETAGAFVHDHLRMRVDGTRVRMEAPGIARNERVLALPADCVVPLEANTLRIDDDRLAVAELRPEVSDTQRVCLESLVALYNATGQVARHKRDSPWHALAARPDLLGELAGARAGTPWIDSLSDSQADGAAPDRLRDSFLIARRRQVGHTETGDPRFGLLPLIDFFRHDPAAAPLYTGRRVRATGHQVAVSAQPVREASAETFLRYMPMDALDSYLTYGFVDDQAALVRSVPVSVRAGGFALHVNARIGARAGRIPPRLQDLAAFVPALTDTEENTLNLSHLFLPGSANPLAVRRVLNHAFRYLDPSLGLSRLKTLVEQAEEQIVAANTAFYDELAARLARGPAGADDAPARTLETVRRLVDHQQAQLATYSRAHAA